MTIYTGRGDDGNTDLRDRSRVPKTDPRIEAYGTVDELNALIGTIRTTGHEDVDACLRTVQNHLHVLQADLANPEPDEDDPRVTEDHVETLEESVDRFDEELPQLTQFVLPTGSEDGAALHHARAVCRRAERRTVAFVGEDPAERPVVTYLNRLSDLLFTLARTVNRREGVGEEHPTY